MDAKYQRLTSALLRIVIVFVAVILVGVALRHATLRFDYSEPKLREALGIRNERLDVAFFGNSLTLEGVNASLLEQKLHVRSYNFAAGGASILQSEFQLRKFLIDNPAPRLVALGVYLDSDQHYLGISPTVYDALSPELKAQFWSESATLEGQPYDKSFVLFNRLDAYRYRGTVDLLLKYLLTPTDTRPHFARGQAQVEFSRSVELGGKHVSDFPFQELESFLRFTEERHLQVLVFEPPIYPGYSELTTNRATAVSSLRALVSRFGAARFVSFASTGQQYPPAEWVNLNHLNLSGSRHFADEISTVIAPYVLAQNH